MSTQPTSLPVDLVEAVADVISYRGFAFISEDDLDDLSEALTLFFMRIRVPIRDEPDA
jgi:hypothetical protein